MAGALRQFMISQGITGGYTFSPSPAILAGSCLILATQATAGVTQTPSGGGVTWIPVATASELQVWIGYNSSGGSGAITCAITGAYTARAGICAEFTGVSVAGPVDNPGAAVNVYPPTVVFTTLQDLDLLYAVWGGRGHGIRTSNPNDGFTLITDSRTFNHPDVSGVDPQQDATMSAGWRNQTLHGGHSPAWTKNDAIAVATIGFGVRVVGPPAQLAMTSAGVGSEYMVLSATSNITVPAAVINVSDRWLFAGTDLSTYAYTVTRSTGADSHPAVRGEDPRFGGLPGRQHQRKLADSRIVTVEMYVHAMTAAGVPQTPERTYARANLDALQRLLSARGQQELIRVMPDGTGRLALAEVWSVRETPVPAGIRGALFGLSVEFYLADPWFYANTIIDGPRSLSATLVNFTLTQPGSVRGYRVLLEFLGPVTSPRVTNAANGVFVQYAGAVGAGNRLYIDCSAFTAFLAGASVVGNVTHGGANEFMALEPGDNPIVVNSTGGGGSLTTYFTPPFV